MTVNERARRIATFRGIEVRLMEMVARWIPTTPEMEIKVLMGRHVWNFAQHADALGKRTWELRQPMHYTLDPVEGFLEFLDRVESIESPGARVGALCRVVIPAMERRYRQYLENTDGLLDAPSVVVIERNLASHAKMQAESESLIDTLELEVNDGDLEPLRELAGRVEDILTPMERAS